MMKHPHPAAGPLRTAFKTWRGARHPASVRHDTRRLNSTPSIRPASLR
jgi:hypothetical protein